MAKKSSRKSSKPARKSAGKSAKGRASATRKAAKPAKRAGASRSAPTPVKTGRGATPREIGDAVVAHFNRGGSDKELWARYWSPRAESVEGEGMAMAWKGIKAIRAKGDWWSSAHTVHSASAEGPFVGAAGFSVKFRIDSEEKETGKRRQMEEIGVYTVQNGKVVREEFMYGPSRTLSEGRPRTAALVDETAERTQRAEEREPLEVGV